MFSFENVKILLAMIIYFICGTLILVSILFGFYSLCGFGKRYKEWTSKVNNCILDKNYRKDCELIIYKEKQNREMNHTEIVPIPIYVGKRI